MAEIDTREARRGTGRPTNLAVGEVRGRIITEAARIFADNGYSGSSIQDIVEAAGTTKPMVYYYFKSKEGLYQEIFRSIHEKAIASQNEIVAKTDLTIREKLVELVEIDFNWAREAPERARFMFAAHFGPRKAMPAVEDADHDHAYFGALVALANQGVESGDLNGDPVMIAQALLGQILIHVMFHVSAPDPIPLTEDAAERVVEQLFRGVAGAP